MRHHASIEQYPERGLTKLRAARLFSFLARDTYVCVLWFRVI